MATGALEKFLCTQHTAVWLAVKRNLSGKTVAGIGPGGWDSRALANAQGQAPADGALLKRKTVYRIYTEDILPLATVTAIIGQYFASATLFYGVGLDARTQDSHENSLTIEIVTSAPDSLQRITNLAGDIRFTARQISVLVTRATVDTFEVTEP